VNINNNSLIPVERIPPGNLRKPRHSRRNLKSWLFPGFVIIFLKHQGRSGTNQRHISPENIEQLGKLIKVIFSQKLTNTSHTWSVFNHSSAIPFFLRIPHHRAEREKRKRLPPSSHPLLAEENRAFSFQHDDQRSRNQTRGDH